jgi:hypothetical protein
MSRPDNLIMLPPVPVKSLPVAPFIGGDNMFVSAFFGAPAEIDKFV